jgi:ketol-acid reductoisomerase
MTHTVAVIGAGGKMGMRLTNNLLKTDYALLLAENGAAGIARLQEIGQTAMPSADAVAQADLVIFAVPDALMRPVTEALVPHAKPGTIILFLDPAAAAANEIPLRDELHYVVCHPCHPPLFGQQEGDAARKDFFGGIAAKQDIVIALLQGSEDAFARAEALCLAAFAPVMNAHRITVEQMAMLEPAMAEVVAATAAVLMREAMDEAITRGVPREAAQAFMMGHAQIVMAIAFGAIDSPFSDAAKVAIQWGMQRIVRPDWRQVFDQAEVTEAIHAMLHPETLA